jgi:hypothetical protein
MGGITPLPYGGKFFVATKKNSKKLLTNPYLYDIMSTTKHERNTILK